MAQSPNFSPQASWLRGARAPELCGEALHEIFEAQARAHPDRPAIATEARRWTYGELDAWADAVALQLASQGVGGGELVVLWMARGPHLYAAMLGVLKVGAAYVPMDAEWPASRAQHIVAATRAKVVFTDRASPDSSLFEGSAVLRVADPRAPGSMEGPAAPPPRRPKVDGDSLAYVIYTSGSTGAPKGVMISHRNAAHLVRAEQQIFPLTPDDRVLQGFSPAFDAAVEEIWLAFAAGATLVPGDKRAMLDDLGGHLTRLEISVFSTVPTLLATLRGDLPGLRLLIVGGESCPAVLVDRWAVGGRKMFNTYGPTEATVIATYAPLAAGRAVTLGQPIPNYDIYLLGPDGEPAAPGEAAEICIGGPGVARGYLDNPPLSEQKFPLLAPHPGAPRQRIYRSGDLGRLDPDGTLAFLGRLDGQVKIRGFRVELGEIEAALLRDETVAQVAVVYRQGAEGGGRLGAFVVVAAGARLDGARLADALRLSLPTYMLPDVFVALPALPVSAGGKVDKKGLPELPAPTRSGGAARRPPRPGLEATLAEVWREVTGAPEVGRDDNFFLDLGGHSLHVAQVVSLLRRRPELAHISVLDIYERPVLMRLAEGLAPPQAAPAGAEAAAASDSPSPGPDIAQSPGRRAPRGSFYLCGLAQAAALYLVFAVCSLQWLGPYLMFAWLRSQDIGTNLALTLAALFLVATYPMLLATAVVAKWLVLGRIHAGRYPLWGSYYFRFWLTKKLVAMAPTWTLVGTPWLAAYYRLLGAKIGRHVHLASNSLCAFDLISLGDDTVVGSDVALRGFEVRGDWLIIGPITVGKRVVLAARSTIDPHVGIGDDVRLRELSRVRWGTQVPSGERWAGSVATPEPAPPVGAAQGEPAQPAPPRPPWPRLALLTCVYGLLALALPLMFVGALLPGLWVLSYFEDHLGHGYLAGSPIVGAAFVATFCMLVWLSKWLVVGRVRPGRHLLSSTFALRKWYYDRTMDMSLDMLGGLYATMFLNPWLRLMGARIGSHTEISTASEFSPDLLTLGDGAFLADCVSIGAPTLEPGHLVLAPTGVGHRTFIGNSAVVPSGTQVGDDCLLGCLSAAPTDAAQARTARSTWFGSPARVLNQRQASQHFGAEQTYHPTRALVAKRFVYEALRVTLPTTCSVAVTCVLMSTSWELHAVLGHGPFIALFPLLYLAMALMSWPMVFAAKWLLMGRFVATERPLWHIFIWRNELVTALHENFADPLLNEHLAGTPFLAYFFRGLGAKIGRRVYLNTTALTEYDLCCVEDGAAVGADATLQTHLFEDRVMKMDRVHVGEGCTVGADAIVLYSSEMEAGSTLAPMSLLMKGERLPAHSHWEGSPARAERPGESWS